MESPDFLDCEYFLAGREQATLTVAGRSYSGKTDLTGEVERRLRTVALEPIRYGTLLFEALFPPMGSELLVGYREGLAIAQHEGRRLRLRIHLAAAAPPEMQDLYWELLYDASKQIALGRSREVALSRYLSVARDPGLPVVGRPRFLLAVAAATDLADYGLPELDREVTLAAAAEAFRPLGGRVSAELLDGPATAGGIRDRLLAGGFHGLHLLAHGLLRPDRPVASMVLESADGRASFLDEAVFAEIFEGLGDHLRLVTLVACHGGARAGPSSFSGLGPALVRRGIPAVIAMRRPISVSAAACFSEHFYRDLARHGRIDAAANEARAQLHLSFPQSLEWGTPAVFMRLREGRLWTASETPDGLPTAEGALSPSGLPDARSAPGPDPAAPSRPAAEPRGLVAVVRCWLSGFGRRYRKQLIYRHRVSQSPGLRIQGAVTPDLENVFVEPHLAPRAPHEVSPDPLRKSAATGHHDVWKLLASDLDAYRCLAILGPPGCGKSTLLQHLALTFAGGRQRRFERRCQARLPILLALRDQAAAVAALAPPTLAELVSAIETRETGSPPAGWFERQLRRGRCLVLLDGLDEVADRERRGAMATWIDRQVRLYGGCRFLVTCRPQGYRTNPLHQATCLEMQPFTFGQVDCFVRGWYAAHEALSSAPDETAADSSVAQSSAEARGEDLVRRLRQSPALVALAVHPLLLTMIVISHRYRGRLPERRADLYAEICEVLLGRWQSAEGLSQPLAAPQLRGVLQVLAFHMMQTQKREIATAEVRGVVGRALLELAVPGGVSPDELLRGVEKGSGLLLEREAGLYSFTHLTFQEYLAARHVVEHLGAVAVLGHVGDPWWHETLRLMSAQSDATELVHTCLEEHGASIEALTLANECLHEAPAVDPEVRRRLEHRLIDGLEAAEPAHRRLAAEVMLSLRLRRLLRVSDGVEIDPEYLSCAEYQLFLDDKLAAEQAHQPDHWTTGHFPRGAARRPVTGVRHSDAEAFCAWLGERTRALTEAGARLRLPTADEARDNPPDARRPEHSADPQTGELAAWCAGEPPRLSTADPLAEARRAELRQLAGAYLRRVLSLSVHLSHDLARALDRDREADRAVLERSVRRAILDSEGSAGTWSRELDRVGDLARGLHLERDLAWQLDRLLERTRKLALELERARVRAAGRVDLDRLADLDVETTSSLAFELDRARSRLRSRTRTLDRALDLVRDVESDLARACDLPMVIARARVRALANAPDEERDGARLALLFLASIALPPHGGTQISGVWSLRRRSWSERLPESGDREVYLDSFWALVLLEERLAGKLPPREAIRIVRVGSTEI